MGVTVQKEFYLDTECECGEDLLGHIDTTGKQIIAKCLNCKDENYDKGFADCQKIKEDV